MFVYIVGDFVRGYFVLQHFRGIPSEGILFGGIMIGGDFVLGDYVLDSYTCCVCMTVWLHETFSLKPKHHYFENQERGWICAFCVPQAPFFEAGIWYLVALRRSASMTSFPRWLLCPAECHKGRSCAAAPVVTPVRPDALAKWTAFNAISTWFNKSWMPECQDVVDMLYNFRFLVYLWQIIVVLFVVAPSR